MTEKEIIAAARSAAKACGHPIPPQGLNMVELPLFWGIYYVCRQYRDGELTAQTAKKLKNRIVTEYGQMDLARRSSLETARRMVKINVILGKAERSEASAARELAKELRAAFEGRDNGDEL